MQNFAIEISMSFLLLNIFGKTGVVLLIGLIVFVASYRNSVQVFDWIERQTFGTRDYILKKCELLHWEITPQRLTYALLWGSVGIGFTVAALLCLTGNFIWGIILGPFFCIVGWKIPRPLVDYFYSKRMRKFQQQMVDALNLLANGLRAGLSLPQACGMVVEELPKPISEEFNMILQQNRIGVPIDECFQNLYVRVPTEDNQMFVTCINILRETGGNLSETFETIAGVIRERVRLQQKIDTFTSLGRLQGTVIFCIPFGMILMLAITNPTALINMFTNVLGIFLLLVAFFLTILGGYIILKIIQIKV